MNSIYALDLETGNTVYESATDRWLEVESINSLPGGIAVTYATARHNGKRSAYYCLDSILIVANVEGDHHG